MKKNKALITQPIAYLCAALASLVAVVHSKVTLRSKIYPGSVLLEKDYTLPLNTVFGFGSAVYPITTSTTVGSTYSYDQAFFKKQFATNNALTKGIAFAKPLSNGFFIACSNTSTQSASQGQAILCNVVRIGKGTSGFDGIVTQIQFGLRDPTTICEDAARDPFTGLIAIGCRAPAKGQNPATLNVQVFDNNGVNMGTESGPYTAQFNISNRVNLVFVRDKQFSINKRVFLVVSDSFVDNDNDVAVKKGVRVMRMVLNPGPGITSVGDYLIQDDEGFLTDLRGIFNFRNQLLAVGKRSDSNGAICFTRLSLTATQITPPQVSVVRTYDSQCTKIKQGFVGLVRGDKVALYDISTSLMNIIQPAARFTDPNWINLKRPLQTYNLTYIYRNYENVVGVRAVYQNSLNHLIIISAPTQGVADAKNSFLYLNAASAQLGKDKLVALTNAAVLINDNYIGVTIAGYNAFLLQAPFLYVPSTALTKPGNVTFNVTAKDSSTAAQVTSQIIITVVNDPYGVIDAVALTTNPPNPIAVAPGAEVELKIPYVYIDQGNDVKFNISYSTGDYSGNILRSGDYNIIFRPQILGRNITYLQIVKGAALKRIGNSTVRWYLCVEEGAYQTGCDQIESSPLLNGVLQNKLGATLEVVYTFTYNSQNSFSRLVWVMLDGEWMYEQYPGQMVDATLLLASDGRIYSILAFTDRLIVSVFYDNKYYGSRQSRTIYATDIESFSFCPKSIQKMNSYTTSFAVLSTCKDSNNIYRFELDTAASDVHSYLQQGDFDVYVIETNYLPPPSTLPNPQICDTQAEVIVFNSKANALYSLDKKFHRLTQFPNNIWKMTPIGLICNQEALNTEFYVLSNETTSSYSESSSDPYLRGSQSSTSFGLSQTGGQKKDIIIFRPGANQDQVYSRVKARITGLFTQITSINAYKHGPDTIFAAIGQFSIKMFYKYFENAPLAITTALQKTLSAKTTYTVTLYTRNNVTAKFNGTLVPRKPWGTGNVVLNKQAVLSNSTFDLTKIVNITGPILNVNLTGPGLNTTNPPLALQNTKSGLTIPYLVGKNNIGSIKFITSNYTVLSSYKKNSGINYGIFQLYNGLTLSDTFFSTNQFLSTDAIILPSQAGSPTTDIIFLYSQNINTVKKISAVVSIDGYFVQATTALSEVTGDWVRIFPGNTSTSFIVAAVDSFMGSLALETITYEANTPGQVNWVIQEVPGSKLTIPTLSTKIFGVVNTLATINFYVVNIYNSNAPVFRVEYIRKTGQFSSLYPISFGAATNVSQITAIKCIKGIDNDRCVFTTTGATHIYAEFGSQLAPNASRNPGKFYTLRMPPKYYASTVNIASRFIVMESTLLTVDDTKATLVWDLGLAPVTPGNSTTNTNDLHVTYITNLTGRARESENSAQMLNSINAASFDNDTGALVYFRSRNPELQLDYVFSREMIPLSITCNNKTAVGAQLSSYTVTFNTADGKSFKFGADKLFKKSTSLGKSGDRFKQFIAAGKQDDIIENQKVDFEGDEDNVEKVSSEELGVWR